MLSFVAYFETLLQLSLHLCQFMCTLLNFGEKKYLFIIFLKNAYSAVFSILRRSYLWKMRGYLQFSFWISIAPDMIYLSHTVIIWEKYFPLVGTVLKCSLHGFHVYKEVWSPIVGEQLKCCYERNNCYDCYAIAATKHLLGRLANSTVGHCPERFPKQHAFPYFVLKSSTRTTEDLP